jgi:hypothetical protein
MAVLKRVSDGRTCWLEAEHVVGRSSRSELMLDRPRVSSQHALLRWNGAAWEVKDLGSRNGTWLDGVALAPSIVAPLQQGARLRFGDEVEEWIVEDASEPSVMATALDGSSTVLAEGSLLAVPAVDDPEVTLYAGDSGSWLVEREDAPPIAIRSGETFEAGGKTWRFCCPSAVAQTQAPATALELRTAELTFAVSADEEYVELRARCSGRDVHLGSRSQFYMLLTLARSRLDDVARGIPEPSAGWIYQDELLRALDVPQSQLNIDVFRVRRQLAAAGFVDAARAIERRASTRQLRVGVSRLRVERI